MDFEVLGPVRLRPDSGQPVRLGRLQRVLLGVLVAHANRPVSADVLADAMWSGEPDRAESNVRLHVHRLRRALGDRERLSFGSGGYRLVVEPGELDAERFESLVDEASDLVGGDPQRGVELLREALGLWQGQRPYDGLDVPLLADEAQRLIDRHTAAMEALYEAELACGRDAEIVGDLSDLVRRYPLRERLAALLMTALYRAGRQAEALQVYQDARRRLVDELGLEPGPELRAVEQQVLAGEPVEIGVRAAAPRPVPAQLPLNVRGFVGREAELAGLDELLGSQDDAADAAVIATLSGTAGVGKSALAVRWAHQVRDRFPDGQLYVNLHGFGPEEPLSPIEALAGFLRALGVDSGEMAREVDERAAQYRSQLDGRRMLVVLDNARTVDQVRALLPGTSSCLVVVTSRSSLTGLGARDGAQRIDLDRMSADEARGLMRELLDDASDLEAVDALVARCARLPLALRVAADLVLSRPARGVAGLVDELADEHDRLDLLDVDEDPHSAVRAVFSWSYQQLAPDAARMFRMAGLHPGRDADPYALAALASSSVRTARRALDALVRAHLIEETLDGHYRSHDLLRAFARELAEAGDAPDRPAEAIARLAGHYLSVVATAMDLIAPFESDRRPEIAATETDAPPLSHADEARRWLDRERASLFAVVPVAPDSYVTGLSELLMRYFSLIGHGEGLPLHQRALEVSQRNGDAHAEMEARRSIGLAHFHLGDYDLAAEQYKRALALGDPRDSPKARAGLWNNLGNAEHRRGRYGEALANYQRSIDVLREIGGGHGIGMALTNAASTYWHLGDYDRAAGNLEEALQHFDEYGDQASRATVVGHLAEVSVRTGRDEAALEYAEQCLAIARAARDRTTEASALNLLGTIHRRVGDPAAAMTFHREALELARTIGLEASVVGALNGLGSAQLLSGEPSAAIESFTEALKLAAPSGLRGEEAQALEGLGDAYAAAGEADLARDHWGHAVQIYRELGVPDARGVATKLTGKT